MTDIISNATPLIAFARIGQLPLMQKVVEQLVIPEAVAEEITAYRGTNIGQIDLSQETWIRVESLQSEGQMRLLLPTLDRGEAAVIALALEKRARLVLMDELTGRKVAESLQIKVTGSVGLLIQAKQLGEIKAVRPLLEAMHGAGIYFSRRFIDFVLQYVGEE
jgi:predicted nucleic acid-binding protein